MAGKGETYPFGSLDPSKPRSRLKIFKITTENAKKSRNLSISDHQSSGAAPSTVHGGSDSNKGDCAEIRTRWLRREFSPKTLGFLPLF
ncbi:hypothetical protein V6Z11_D12G073900 [Gossypium hirsutum]